MIVRPVVCRPFIGRHDELSYLHELRLEAGASRGKLVLVAGEAGVGKSRLLAEFSASLANSRWRIGAGTCLEFAQRPYGPIVDVLARIAPDAAVAPAASKYEQLEAIVGTFANVTARTAAIAIVEDLHWADVATIETLTHLGTKIGTMRLLVVVSLRDEEFHPDHPGYAAFAKLARTPNAGRIDLAPFAGPELREFIDEALSGIALPDEMRAAVARAGDGNPFFTEELLKSAVEGVSRNQRSARPALPPTVQATLMERLRPLSEHERAVLSQAAVIGRTFDLRLLARTLDTDVTSLLPPLRRARDVQLVSEESGTRFRFRHALTREAIYGQFLAAEAQPLHRTIGAALESDPDELGSLESLAYHWWAAGDPDRSSSYNEKAGDAAAQIHAPRDAVLFYERAMDHIASDSPQRGAIAEKLAARFVTLGFTDRALAAYSTAAEIFAAAGDGQREATNRVGAALQAYSLDHPHPTAPLEAMLERIDADDIVARARVHLGIAWVEATFYRPIEAQQHIDKVDPRAIEAAPEVRLRVHNIQAWIAMSQRDTARFRTEHALWLAATKSAGTAVMAASVHYNGAFCYAILGCLDEALSHAQTGLQLAREERSRYGEVAAQAILALCHLLRGDLPLARPAIEAVRALPIDDQVITAHAVAWGSLTAAHLGDDALIAHWFDRVEATISTSTALMCAAGYAELYARRARPERAQALLHTVLALGDRARGIPLTLLAVARYGAMGDVPAARAMLGAGAAATSETIERHALALFDAYVAQRDGRHDAAADGARTAAGGFSRLGLRLLEAAALELAGESERALALYRSCGAAYDVRRLEGASGVVASRQDPVSPDDASLSSREREIAALVARGGSNVEIARTLSISHKTVEKHVGSIYRKLGLSNRAQLGAYISRGDSAVR